MTSAAHSEARRAAARFSEERREPTRAHEALGKRHKSRINRQTMPARPQTPAARQSGMTEYVRESRARPALRRGRRRARAKPTRSRRPRERRAPPRPSRNARAARHIKQRGRNKQRSHDESAEFKIYERRQRADGDEVKGRERAERRKARKTARRSAKQRRSLRASLPRRAREDKREAQYKRGERSRGDERQKNFQNLRRREASKKGPPCDGPSVDSRFLT